MKPCTLALAAALPACGPARAQHARHTVDLGVLCASNRDARVDGFSGTGVPAQAGARDAIDPHWSVLLSLGLNWSLSDITVSDAAGTQMATLAFRPVIVDLADGYNG